MNNALFWVGVVFFGSLVLTLIGLVLRHDALFWISFIILALVALVFIGSVLGKILDNREKKKGRKSEFEKR